MPALLSKQQLRKVVEAVAHDAGIVPIGVHAPHVGHPVFRQVIVKPLADAQQVVPVADREAQQLQLLEGGQLGDEIGRRPGVRGSRDGGDPGELTEVGQPMFKVWPPPMDIPAIAG